MSRSNLIKTTLRLLLTTAVMVVSTLYLLRHRQDFTLLLGSDPRHVAAMLLAPLAAIHLNGLTLRLLVRAFGVRLTISESFGLTTLHAFGNYLPLPQVGSVARGVYLKRVHGLRYISFLATLVATYVPFVTGLGATGLLVAALMWVGGRPMPWPLNLLFLVLLCGWLAPSLMHRLLPAVEKIRELATQAGRLRPLWPQVLALQAGVILVNSIALWLAFLAIGRPRPLLTALTLTVVSQASGIARVTPGNIGLAESAAWVTAKLLDTDPALTVVAYTLFRLMSILPVLALTPLFTLRLARGLPDRLA